MAQLIVQGHRTVAKVHDGEVLVRSHRPYGLTLVGRLWADHSWQAQAGKGFDVAHFSLDWQAQLAPCRQAGPQQSPGGLAEERREVGFAREVCAACPLRLDCTKSSIPAQVLQVRASTSRP